MAKVEKWHFDRDRAFTNGMEEGVGMVKRIFEMLTYEREMLFDETDVAKILDKYEFWQIKEILEGRK